jgi:hypothetical protein
MLPSRTALHEAGHCIGSLTFGTPVKLAVVGRGHPAIKNSTGYVAYSAGRSDPWEVAVTALSGEAADELFLGLSARAETEDHVAAIASLGRVPGIDPNNIDEVINALAAVWLRA